MMSFLSVSKFQMLRETAVLHGSFQQRVVIGTDDLPGIGKSDSLMSGLCSAKGAASIALSRKTPSIRARSTVFIGKLSTRQGMSIVTSIPDSWA